MTPTLNLIPPSYKHRLRLQRLYLFLKDLFVFVTIYLIGLAIVLLAARQVLQRNFARIVEETTLVTQSNREVERRIADLNADIDVAARLQGAAAPWAELLAALTKLVPDGVVLRSLDLQTTGTSSATGTARTRADLLAFRDALAATPYLGDVTLPVAYLLERENANFTLTFTVKLADVPALTAAAP